MVVVVAGVATAGAAVYSAYKSGKAADAQVDSAQQAQDYSWAMYQQNRADNEDFVQGGRYGLNLLTGGAHTGGGTQPQPTYENYLSDFNANNAAPSPGAVVGAGAANAFNNSPGNEGLAFYGVSNPNIGGDGTQQAHTTAPTGLGDTGAVSDTQTNRPLSREEWQAQQPAAAPAGGLMAGPQMSDFEASPYYRYAREEQVRDTTRALGGQGLYGASLDAIPDTVNHNVLGNYGNFVNDWLHTKLNPAQSLAGLGQTSGMNLGQQGLATAGYMGSAAMNAGNARASGYQAQANTVGAGIKGITDLATNPQVQQTVGGWFGGGQATNANQYNNPNAFDPQWNPSWGLG